MTDHAAPPVIIITGDFVPTGGMDRANLALAQYLATQGRAVHLVAHRADESLLKFKTVTFHKVPRPLGSHWLGGPLLNLYGQYLVKSLARRSRQRPQVVVNGGNCRTPLATLNWAHYVHAAWAPGKPAGIPRRVKAALSRSAFLKHEKQAFQQAPLVIANSHLTAHQISTAYQIPAHRVQVLYYGTDPSEFGPVTPSERQQARQKLGLPAGDNLPVVLFVGAMGDTRKGFDLLFEAWRLLNQNSAGWPARLLVVGSGAALPACRQVVEAAGLQGQITFLGFRNDVPELLAAADLLVSPARYEAYGLNVHEALCRGCPVLVSASAGVAERLPEDAASMRLPLELTAENLATALAHWHNHQPEYQQQAAKIGQALRKETWPSQMEKLVGLMNQRT